MRWSKLFIPTLREAPADSKSATHALLIRAGYMRGQNYLFCGARVLRKIVAVIREELDAIGAQEMLWKNAGAAEIAGELRSYKQLPQLWYQFDGFIADGRCFAMPESDESFVPALRRILDRCGLHYVEAGTHFLVPSEEGEDVVRGNGYAARLDLAKGVPRPPALPDPEGDLSPEEFHTPGQKTIADLSAFTGLPESSQMKSVVMAAGGEPVLVMLRGDHQLSEAKLRLYVPAADLRPARAEEIRRWFGADAGSLGPVGVKNMRVIADVALEGRRNMICGANRNDYHLRNVTPGEDFQAEFFDLRLIAEGDTIESQPFRIEKALIPANWAWRFSQPASMVTYESGELAPIAQGFFRLHIDQIVRAAVTQFRDEDGLALPPSLAPFQAVITPVFFAEEQQQRAAGELYDSLRAAGIDALLDDRDERPGVKFKDADLVGIPYRITIGKKLTQGMVEIRDRRARTSQDVVLTEAVSFLEGKLK